MNVALINPPHVTSLTLRPSYTAEPHLGLAYIAAALQDQGVSVSIIDADAMGYGIETTAHLAEKSDPIFIGITAHTAMINSAAKVAEAIKRINPARRIVIGGYHATAMPGQTLEEYGSFDYAAFGEGEGTSVELAKRLESEGALEGLPGLARRNGGTVSIGRSASRVLDLDTLPMPAWELFPLGRYQAHYRKDHGVLELPVNTGRGCLGRCKMCARVTGGVLRRRSAQHIIEEIYRDIERFGAGAIVFMDETFAASPDLVERLCEGMIERGINKRLYWLCQTRVDSVTPELLSLMARSGCRHISFGVEAADPERLAEIGKGINREQVIRAVGDARSAGIFVDNFFILGLPGDTSASIKRTVNFALELDSDFANFFLLVPYPGTEIFQMAKRGENGLRLMTTNWDYYGIQMGKSLELKGLPRRRLEMLQLYAYLRFYLRPRKLRNMFRMVNLKVLPIYLFNLIGGMFFRRFSGGRDIRP